MKAIVLFLALSALVILSTCSFQMGKNEGFTQAMELCRPTQN